MWRVLAYLVLLGIAAYGAVWLANNPETVAVTWAGREYTASLAVGVVGFLAAAVLLALAFGVTNSLINLPRTLRAKATRRRMGRGHTALSRGLIAVAAGDAAAARRHAGEAQRLLPHEPTTLLLKAQAAQALGDRSGAEAAFREMAERRDTRLLGLRGLYLEALRRDETEEARQYAGEAARLAPALGWASDAVLDGYSAQGDWSAAIRWVERRASLGLIDKATSRRQRAVLLTADALAREPNDPDGALASAEQAAKLAPSLVPAAALAARLLSRRGDLRRAAKIVEAAWKIEPHPELAAAYLNLRPGDSGGDRLRRAETLASLSSWSDEARLAIARAAIETRDLARAREVLRPILDEGDRPTVRVCLVMAEVEGRGGNAGAAREWLARAARAPRDKAWIADGFVSDRWAPVSPVSGRLDAFRWETPPETLAAPAEIDTARFDPDEQPEEELPPFLHRAAPLEVAAPEPAEAGPKLPESGPQGGAERAVDQPRPEPASAGPDPVGDTVLPEPSGGRPAETVGRPASPGEDAAQKPVPNGSGPARRAGPGTEPEPVVFPVAHAPDDPGSEAEGDRRQRFRLRV